MDTDSQIPVLTQYKISILGKKTIKSQRMNTSTDSNNKKKYKIGEIFQLNGKNIEFDKIRFKVVKWNGRIVIGREQICEFHCKLCSKSFFDPNNLREHFYMHVNTDCLADCPLCTELLLDDEALKYHLNIEHGDKNYSVLDFIRTKKNKIQRMGEKRENPIDLESSEIDSESEKQTKSKEDESLSFKKQKAESESEQIKINGNLEANLAVNAALLSNLAVVAAGNVANGIFPHISLGGLNPVSSIGGVNPSYFFGPDGQIYGMLPGSQHLAQISQNSINIPLAANFIANPLLQNANLANTAAGALLNIQNQIANASLLSITNPPSSCASNTTTQLVVPGINVSSNGIGVPQPISEVPGGYFVPTDPAFADQLAKVLADKKVEKTIEKVVTQTTTSTSTTQMNPLPTSFVRVPGRFYCKFCSKECRTPAGLAAHKRCCDVIRKSL